MAHELSPAPARLDTEEAAAVAGALGAVAAAELVVVFLDTPVGAALHAVLAFVLVLQWIVREPTAFRRGLAALALVPIARVVSMALVLPDLEPASWGTVAAALVLASCVLMVRALEAGGDARLAPPRSWTLAAVVGAAAVLLAVPAAASIERQPATGVTVAFLLLAAVAEELLFRGVVQGTLRPVFGRGALLYANVAFVTMYLATLSLAMVLVAAILGLMAGWLVERTRSIWPAIGVHAAFSLGAGVLWPAVLPS